MAFELVTLNRPLTAKNAEGEVVQLSAFTGRFVNWSGAYPTKREEVRYLITKIHLPKEVHLVKPIYINFKKTAIVSTQEVAA